MLYQIYLVTNIINNKKYVGQTYKTNEHNYLNRFNDHLKTADYCNKHGCNLTVFYKAIIKYGSSNFSVELLADDISEEDVDNLESYYIDKYSTFYINNEGYNMTLGGQGIHNYKHTLESKNKISDKSKEYWNNLKENNVEEYERLCLLRSTNLKGKPKTPEAKNSYKEAFRKRVESSLYVNPFKGKHHTDKTKDMISKKNGCKLGMYDPETDELLRIFQSCPQANKYLIEKNLTKNKYVATRILIVCDDPKKLAYGFRWRKLEK